MKRIIIGILISIGMVITVDNIVAQTKSKIDPEKEKKVINLVNSGIAYIQKNGIDKAVKTFQDTKGGFIDGEFYIFLYDFEGNALVVGSNTSLIGKNLMNISSTDRNGNKVYQVKELINIAKTKGEGWFEWAWQNPETKKFGPKRGYAKRIDVEGKSYMIGSGYYVGDED
jgi:cytochrome c